MIYEKLFYSNSKILMPQDENVTSHALLYQTPTFLSIANICENLIKAWCCEMSFWVYYKGLLHDLLSCGTL
jgi:hypothetical protein